ncbi:MULTISPECIES: high-affinity branched-chain amino acid ABC transporter permease LivM [Comamonas]|jgi:branched-chain amino acid transport system permease protein|uniref:High-affinity branched-chain amino acid ABC transporter permease LivM n=1 Tax=Comamonas terrigena TaxID=32013 RepID=A0A2A7UWT4_COMTR|nr:MULTISPECIES: high-affinity branched-chain amino acid ABC transporter permease LivM [Comamonas]MBP7353256.1 high-affinity branched-chain amino acid ABC transporter permease LivM [Comamonas sp.]MBD9531392.1 high-affinity branched-chain amino acid ABC transporter permease LivM [Comamonas sp. CMM01]MDH0050079.1 high-affinity branched-chain amino acid ABC transporter permease LivM [Comamonas terrigena]MDH0512357.1 high-affinity branched-chain amino acid ABC transporter permease LivM [Comamonas t
MHRLRLQLGPALLAALVTALVVTPIFGLHLERAGMRTTLVPQWDYVLWACAIVFVWQLVRPAVRGVTRTWSLPSLPTVPERHRNGLILAMLLFAVSWPFFAGRNAVDIATLAMIYVMLGLGLNIVVGFAGLLDLGFVGFYAVGAYTYALLYHWAGWSFWEALPLSGAMSALFGFALGFPVLRLRGDYLAIVTLGFGEIIRLLLVNLTDWTGGPDGISSIPKPTVMGLPMTRSPLTEDGTTFHQFFGLEFNSMHMVIFLYLMALLLAVVTLLISNRLIRMPIGRAWEALREDEIACRSLGLNPMKIKLSAFTLGAMFAGFGGAFFAARQGIVNPESFTFIESALILAIVVLGGMGSQIGVIVAAILLTVLPELAREFSEYRMLIFGLVMILMMVWRPQGLLPMKRHHVQVPQAPSAKGDAA